MEKYDIIIMGAGLSGLSLAHYCGAAGYKTLVIEKTERTGGTFHTFRMDTGADRFWLELGAHTSYNSYGNFIGLVESSGIAKLISPKGKAGYKMFIRNRIEPLPSQINFLDLLLSVPRVFSLKKNGLDIKTYYSGIFGKKNYERVFGPAFSAVICQDADEFPAEMLFQKRKRRKEVLRQFTFQDGLQTATDSIAGNNITFKTGVQIENISFDGTSFALTSSDAKAFESQWVALATPVPVSGRLLKDIFPEAAELLLGMKFAAVDSIGIVVRKEAMKLGPVAGIIPANDIFYSVVSRDAIPHGRYRGFTFHFKPDAAGRDAKFKKMSEVLGVETKDLEFVAERENSVPSLRSGHRELIQRLDLLLADKPILLTGNYFGGVSIEDCVSRSLREFERFKKG